MGVILSPREQFTLFDRPRETLFSISTTPKKVADENPDRIAIVFSAPGGTTIVVSTRSNVLVQEGITVPANAGPVVFTQRDSGNLCQSEWYAICGVAAANMTVIEVVLPYWPDRVRSDGTGISRPTGNVVRRVSVSR